DVQSARELSNLLLKDSMSPLTAYNNVQLLINGENKFPQELQAIREAIHHIHVEYYIYEDDEIGNAMADALIQKAKEGIEVRFIYDDFGSRSIRKKLVRRLKAGGVKTFPFYEVIFIAFANRLNYRNHRKILVVDGKTAFVGGINVSDRYINNSKNEKKLFWRDTHLRIDGPGVMYLQYLFLCDWNFCANDQLHPDSHFFPSSWSPVAGSKVVQIAASGPDSNSPTILFALLQAINLATEEILITTPYFIPGESLVDALVVAALGGVSVKLLVPGVSDSALVNAAAHSYYEDLLNAGVEIYLYGKGFVHAKTMVTDKKIAIVGTANMDYRSFDLNFEVNAVVYDRELSAELSQVFYDDIRESRKIDAQEWKNRSEYKQFLEKAARLVSPLL
ncbi:MAG TPA: cardiolipin synthase, partial [Agriterribacter sp.]|nr:cardiolipin synthase [Agriterribacter sp.]